MLSIIRTRFVWRTGLLVLLAGLALSLTLGGQGLAAQPEEVIHAPQTLSWQARIAPRDEPGQPLVISGTVYAPDGATPST
jgi:hypothetical protein